MKATNNSPICRTFRPRAAALGLVASAVLGALPWMAVSEEMYRPATNSPGGVLAQSAITSVTTVGTNSTVCWYGMQGWYTVEMSTNAGGTWTAVGRTAASDHAGCLTVNNGGNNSALFRLSQNNAFVGSGGCAGCHGDQFSDWMGTRHAKAFDAITNEVAQASELISRTVGYGQPNGFISRATTPQLKHVGCESCHGPSAWHKYSDHDLIRPAVTLAPEVCGGCHEGIHNEYNNSLHAGVVDSIRNTLTNTTTAAAIIAGYDRQMTCGVCHSAATRLAMLNDYQARLEGRTNELILPVAADAGAWGPSCATCHDPHVTSQFTNIVVFGSNNNTRTNVVTSQMRNPHRSTNYYTMPTTSDRRTVITTNFMGVTTTNIAYYNTTFASMYDPNIQICAQCHNTRGARWDNRTYGRITNGASITVGLTTNISSSWRYPHSSPQYNMLIGIVQNDYLTTNSSGVATNWLQRHGTSVSSSGNFNENQCVTCHVPAYTDGTTGAPITGHTFRMDTIGCELAGCHSSGRPSIEEMQHTTKSGLARVVSLLNQWATNKAPALLGAAYANHLANSWEYTAFGGLATLTNAGPSGANQARIPDVIKQARFNTYMVKQDGSYGLHNPRYASGLIADAESKVLSQFPLANFRAYAAAGFAPFTAGFINPATGVTDWSWDFGDGNVSTLATPTNTYASPGLYSVRLTATGPSGSETVVRTDYITVASRPVVSFTGGPVRTNVAPLTVNFTNTSTSTNSVVDWRWYIDGKSIWSQDAVYAFTNAGNYNIQLRAYTVFPGSGGIITTTSNAYIVVTAP